MHMSGHCKGFDPGSYVVPSLTLQELSIYGKLRKVSNCGPVSMFRSLLVTWKGKYPPHVIAKRVKDFFRSAFTCPLMFAPHLDSCCRTYSEVLVASSLQSCDARFIRFIWILHACPMSFHLSQNNNGP